MQEQVSENEKSCTSLALFPGSPQNTASNRKLAEAWEEASTLILLTLVQELNVSGVVSVQDVWP